MEPTEDQSTPSPRHARVAEAVTDKSTSETGGETTETGGDSTESTKSQSPDDKVICSIRMNNQGLDLLMHGRLQEARCAFVEASNLYGEAVYYPSYDVDAREFASNWVCIRSVVNSIAHSDSIKNNLKHIFLYGLRVGDEIDDSSSDDSDDRDTSTMKCDSIDVLRTTRIDWAISYNLGLVTQFLGLVTTNVWGMTYRADSFDRYEKLAQDVVAWYDGVAPLDAAILMLALHNNQGSIYRQLDVGYQVETYWGRMRSIINASKSLREHSICQTFVHNLTYLMRQRQPAAAA
eukprot:scaffold10270_cov125-Cylindrotheca_fusiformis.AAC.4